MTCLQQKPEREILKAMFGQNLSIAVAVTVVSLSIAFSPRMASQPCSRYKQIIHHCGMQVDDRTTTINHVVSGIGFYIHIPYCRRRCRYCDFAIVPIGIEMKSETQNAGFVKMEEMYRSALIKEVQGIQQREMRYRHFNATASEHQKVELQSIYFGGGTPSLAPIETIAAILNAITTDREENPFTVTPEAEITIEMDPGTFSQSKLEQLRELGINRISLGVQSFDDVSLERIGRIHRRDDVLEAIEMIYQVFGNNPNYSIDLISGLPALTMAKWVETLQFATSSLMPRPTHISIYDLQVEQGTVFGSWYQEQSTMMIDVPPKKSTENQKSPTREQNTAPPPLPSAEDCAFFYKFAAGYLKSKNYEHYEVSSYAYVEKPSRRSRHNQVYWNVDGQWYAIGLGSTSSVHGQQVARPRKLADYLQWVDEQQSLDQRMDNTEDKDCPNPDDNLDRLSDIVMKRLRTSDGLDLQWVEKNFGSDIVRTILEGASLGLDLGLAETIQEELTADDTADYSGKTLRLVDPEGLLYSNYIISEIFSELGAT